MEWRRELESGLGELTATRRTILDLATMRAIMLDAGYKWLIEQIEAKGGLGLVNARRRQLYPIAQQLVAISDSQERAMERLGLDRVPVTTETENEVIRLVRGDLRRARRKKPKPESNGIPSNPQEPTSTTEPIQESAAGLIAQEPPTTPTTPST